MLIIFLYEINFNPTQNYTYYLTYFQLKCVAEIDRIFVFSQMTVDPEDKKWEKSEGKSNVGGKEKQKVTV